MFHECEFDETMIAISAMNIMLHGVENPDLYEKSSLEEDYDIADKYTLVLAKPPFKGSLEASSVAKSLAGTVKTKKTELLFLALMLRILKTESSGTDQVWFYDMHADGFSLNDKRTPSEENDIPDILNRWNNLKAEKTRTRLDQSFFVPVQEIRDNNYDLSINKYKEVVYEQKLYDAPNVILERLDELDKGIVQTTFELKKLIIEGGL